MLSFKIKRNKILKLLCGLFFCNVGYLFLLCICKHIFHFQTFTMIYFFFLYFSLSCVNSTKKKVFFWFLNWRELSAQGKTKAKKREKKKKCKVESQKLHINVLFFPASNVEVFFFFLFFFYTINIKNFSFCCFWKYLWLLRFLERCFLLIPFLFLPLFSSCSIVIRWRFFTPKFSSFGSANNRTQITLCVYINHTLCFVDYLTSFWLIKYQKFTVDSWEPYCEDTEVGQILFRDDNKQNKRKKAWFFENKITCWSESAGVFHSLFQYHTHIFGGDKRVKIHIIPINTMITMFLELSNANSDRYYCVFTTNTGR